MVQRYPVTPAGHKRLRAELRQMIEVERPAAVLAIETARAHGDLSENAEYDYAKDKQGMLEAKIRDLEAKLSMAEVIDPTTMSGDKVMFGATVTLEDLDTDEELTYKLLGGLEADIKQLIISIESPIGRALLGKEVDDEVVINVPRGKRIVTVTGIEYK
ncbi:MAG: transcription elongation factor GreA [Deltaproteobacteria bacterium]|nr:transcription elongation factor GreA [Deltaproteobacteria bacterium]